MIKQRLYLKRRFFTQNRCMIIHCRKHEGTAEVAALLISMCTFGSEIAYAFINFSAYLNICVYGYIFGADM